jgi:hypothetical protein
VRSWEKFVLSAGALGLIVAVLIFVAQSQFPQLVCAPTSYWMEKIGADKTTPAPDVFDKVTAPPAPSVTPLPLKYVIDLAPGLDDKDKISVYIMRCDGSFELFLFGPSEENIDDKVSLGLGDVIINISLPALIKGSPPPGATMLPVPTQTNQPLINKCESTPIAMLQKQLTLIPSPDFLRRQEVERKIEAWETIISICKNITPGTGFPKVTDQFTPFAPIPFITGIFEGQPGAFFHGWEAKIENHWKGMLNGRFVFVFAGAWVSDPNQGFLAVYSARRPVWGYYPTATKSGALRIMEEKDDVLVIQSARGEVFYFNVLLQQYVTSLEKDAPTITPLPTSTSTETPPPYPYPYP